jgi:hypothetical protein
MVLHKNLAYLGALNQKEIENLIRGLNSLKDKPYTFPNGSRDGV